MRPLESTWKASHESLLDTGAIDGVNTPEEPKRTHWRRDL
jgi:hypothetical protein